MAFHFFSQSDSATHFTTAIAQNAAESEDITLPSAYAGVGGSVKARIRSLVIISKENLAWEVLLYSKTSFAGTTVDTDTFLARWSFVATDAVQVAATGDYLYYVDGLDQAYIDESKAGQLHVRLVNRSVATKTANAAGAVVVKFGLEPMMVY